MWRVFEVTTDSKQSFLRYPNLLKEAIVDAPDRAWSADIPYVHFPAAFCYLASIIDEYFRYYCAGWHLSRWIDARLTVAALEMDRRAPPAGPVPVSCCPLLDTE